MHRRCIKIEEAMLPEPEDDVHAANTFSKRVQEGKHRSCGSDPTMYTGKAGTAIMLMRLGEFEDAQRVILATWREYDSTGDPEEECSLLCGSTGHYYAMAMIMSKSKLDPMPYVQKLMSWSDHAIKKLRSDEWLYGRAGYLFALLSLKKDIKGCSTLLDPLIKDISNAMITSGMEYAKKTKSSCPLMYSWPPRRGDEYIGAAHGVMGIWYMLLHCPLSDAHLELVRRGIHWLTSRRQSNGNWPAVEGESDAKLVHFCHGAPGAILLYLKAYEVFKTEEYLRIAQEAGEVTYQYGVLKKGLGLCHGVAGNGYTFLALYRTTKDRLWLERAQTYGNIMRRSSLPMRTPDNPLSLFEGLAGTVCFLTDLQNPMEARFPLFEL